MKIINKNPSIDKISSLVCKQVAQQLINMLNTDQANLNSFCFLNNSIMFYDNIGYATKCRTSLFNKLSGHTAVYSRTSLIVCIKLQFALVSDHRHCTYQLLGVVQ